MNYLLCRNRVRNFDQWKNVFDSHANAHGAAGLKLVHLWYELDSPRNVFFLFEVEDVERARAFLNSSDATAERESGLIEGDFRFFGESLGYGPLQEAESRAFAEASEKVASTTEANLSSLAEPVNRPAPPEPAKIAELEKSSTLAEAVKSSVPPEPVKSAEPRKSSTPAPAVQSSMPPDLVKSSEAEEISRRPEPVKTPEPAKASPPPAAMKGPERVKSTPPPAPAEGSEPAENWPAAEAAEQSPLPAFNRRRWVRSKY